MIKRGDLETPLKAEPATPVMPMGRKRLALPSFAGFQPYEILALGFLGLLIVPFWPAVVVAFITAAGLQPVIRRLQGKARVRRGPWALLTVSILSAIMVGMTSYTALRVAKLTTELTTPTTTQNPAPQPTAKNDTSEAEPAPQAAEPPNALLVMRGKITKLTNEWAPSYRKDVERFLNALPKTVVSWLATHAQGVVSSSLELLTQLAFFFIFLFFFLSKGRAMAFNLLRRSPKTNGRIRLWFELVETAGYASVISTAAIGFIQATFAAIAFSLLGFPEWGLIFFGCFILSFVPMLGAAVIPFTVGVYSVVTGETQTGLILLALSAFVGSIDNVLRAYMVTSDKDMNQLIAFVALIGAITIFGFPGLLIGPFLVSLGGLLLGNKAKEGFRPL